MYFCRYKIKERTKKPQLTKWMNEMYFYKMFFFFFLSLKKTRSAIVIVGVAFKNFFPNVFVTVFVMFFSFIFKIHVYIYACWNGRCELFDFSYWDDLPKIKIKKLWTEGLL